MNFFARQAQTRRLSRQLIVLFVLAVAAVVVAVDLVVFTILANFHHGESGFSLPGGDWLVDNTSVVLATTLGVLAIIGIASLYKTSVLRGGGGVVARSLGGVRVPADTTDANLRRLVNVVEEMAIASGVPAPEIYLLEQETGINAFAAGHNPANAAVAVTRGALTQLNRAELQGVIAHEFSHILNGDMRLNVRLMGWLFGLLVLSIIARTVLRLAPRGRSNRKGGGALGVIVLVAVAVLIIGYIGSFFGRLIQAAVARARESLADASAVQFTRDPQGLRGALVKIGATSAGSRILNPEGEEVGHMLFASGGGRLFATHPPLIERLKLLDPQFDPAEFAAVRQALARRGMDDKPLVEQVRAAQAAQTAVTSTAIASLVGNPGAEHVRMAEVLRRTLPASIEQAAHQPGTARALLFALALDAARGVREQQHAFIAQQLGAAVLAQIDTVQSELDELPLEQRLPALWRAFPALRALPREERLQLLSTLNGLLHREGALSLRSYVLRKLAQVHLRDEIDPAARHSALPLTAVTQDVQVLFCVLAQHGHDDESAARRAYEMGVHHLYPRERPEFMTLKQWAAPLDRALSRLDRLAPLAKEQLVEALVKTIAHDQRLTLGEAEMLRAVCATLHCPLPPLVNSGEPSAARL